MEKSIILEELRKINTGDKNVDTVIDQFEKLYPDIKCNRECIHRGLVMFTSSQKSDLSDPINREANGLIIDIKNMEIVCRPYTKLQNWDDPSVPEMDYYSGSTAYHLLEGITVTLWYDRTVHEWTWSSKDHIYAYDHMLKPPFEYDPYGEDIYEINNLMYLIRRSSGYMKVQEAISHQEHTLVFDCKTIGPNNGGLSKTMVGDLTFIFNISDKHLENLTDRYSMLTLLGARRNEDGADFDLIMNNVYIGGIADSYLSPADLIYDCSSNLLGDNIDEFIQNDKLLARGYVVVHRESGNKVRVECPLYIIIRAFKKNNLDDQCLRALLRLLIFNSSNNDEELKYERWRFTKLDQLLRLLSKKYPDKSELIWYYKYQVELMRYRVQRIVISSRQLSMRLSGLGVDGDDTVAGFIKAEDSIYKPFGEIAIQHPNYSVFNILKEWFDGASIEELTKVIPKYKSTPLSTTQNPFQEIPDGYNPGINATFKGGEDDKFVPGKIYTIRSRISFLRENGFMAAIMVYDTTDEKIQKSYYTIEEFLMEWEIL